jgi:hypothetical protein
MAVREQESLRKKGPRVGRRPLAEAQPIGTGRLQARRALAADRGGKARGAAALAKKAGTRRWSGKAASPNPCAVAAAEPLVLELALVRRVRRGRRASGPSRCRGGASVHSWRNIGRWKSRLRLGSLVGFRSSGGPGLPGSLWSFTMAARYQRAQICRALPVPGLSQRAYKIRPTAGPVT